MNRYLQKVKTILDKTELADRSKELYLGNMKKIYILSNQKKISFLFLKDVENIKSIADTQPDTSKKSILVSIGSVLQHVAGFKNISKQYFNLSNIVTKKLNDDYLENKLSDKQQKKLKPFSEFKKVLDVLKLNYINKKNKTNKKKYLLGLMYLGSDFTPRLDFANMKIISNFKSDNGKDNFLNITKRNMTIILNDYKTDSKYGKIKFTLPPKMTREIRGLLEENQEFLFPSNKGGHIRKNKFSEFIKNTFSEDNTISLNDIRIMKESDIQARESYNKMTQIEKNRLHIVLFQHSFLIAHCIYRKVDLQGVKECMTENKVVIVEKN